MSAISKSSSQGDVFRETEASIEEIRVPKRLPVPLTPSMRSELDQISKRENASLGETAKRMIKRALFVDSLVEEKNGHLIVEGEDGNPYYVVFED